MANQSTVERVLEAMKATASEGAALDSAKMPEVSKPVETEQGPLTSRALSAIEAATNIDSVAKATALNQDGPDFNPTVEVSPRNLLLNEMFTDVMAGLVDSA